MQKIKLSNKKIMLKILFASFLVLIALIIRIGFLQFVKGEELQTLAYDQQVLNRNINAKRGTIYDSTGKYILAVSSTVSTITINPTNISKENKEKVAKALSDIFKLDYETVLKKSKEKKFYRNNSKKG